MFWRYTLMLYLAVTTVVESSDEKALYRKLFKSYLPVVRPRHNVQRPVLVTLGFHLLCIGGLSEVSQILYTVGFVVAEWEDDFLQWNPNDYGGIEHLILPPSTVWLPDFAISNSADTFYHETFSRDFRVDVKYTGRVLWEFGGNFATSCTLDMTYYPFDSQSCQIVIDNWAYTRDAVDLINATATVTTTDISANGEWDLVRTEAYAATFQEDTHPGKLFPRVVFTLHMHRKPLYYFLNIITPCLFCIIISIMVFWLPPESGEKVSLGITVLLSFSVFQLVVADSTPKTSDFTPLLSMLMSAIMGMATLSVLSSILVLYQFHHSSSKRAPAWLRKLAFRGLARVLCMGDSVPSFENPQATVSPDDVPGVTGVTIQDSDSALKCLASCDATGDLGEIKELLAYIVRSMKAKEREHGTEEEWRALALVLDRVFFWIITITAVILIPTFLLQSDASLV